MAKYQNVVEYGEPGSTELVQIGKDPAQPKKGKKWAQRGCEFCPSNHRKGIKKVKNLDKVVGRKLMIWAQSPGKLENVQELELVGRAGKMLWQELERVGIQRSMADVQNVVRCRPVDEDEFGAYVDRDPTKEELHCCSLYNEEAARRNGGKAVVHLVLGRLAPPVLFGKEYKKDQKIFFSKKWNAWVVCTYHPAYFLRGAARSKLLEFRSALETVASKLKTPGRFSYVLSRDYTEVGVGGLEQLAGEVRQAASKGIRTVFDFEDGTVQEKKVVLCLGMCWQRGHARVVYLDHPEKQNRTPEQRGAVLNFYKDVLEDQRIPKCLQHGDYDVTRAWETLGMRMRGYEFDTQYAEYLRFSQGRSYSLESIAGRRFQKFAGHKKMVEPWEDPKTGLVDYARVPRKVLTPYCGADCDLTKHIEVDDDKYINHSLLRVYMWVAFVMDRMEERGPWFDWEHAKLLKRWLPIRLAELEEKLRKWAGDKDFNPRSPDQVHEVMFRKLKLQKFLERSWWDQNGYTTEAETMEMLGKFHEFPRLMSEHRKLSKKKGTYVDGYERSAEKHGGRLRTIWQLTGAVTGRLRSGGSRDKKAGLVNLQNIHGDKAIECLLVSDVRWREVFREWLRMRSQNRN